MIIRSKEQIIASLKILALVLLLYGVTAANQFRRFHQVHLNLNKTQINFDVPDGKFYVDNWLSPDIIVLVFSPEGQFSRFSKKFLIYDMTTAKREFINTDSLNEGNNCDNGGVSGANSFADGVLYFFFECQKADYINGELSIVRLGDIQNIETVFQFPKKFVAHSFTLSPDKKRGILDTSPGLTTNSLYYFNDHQNPQQLFPNFFRAGSPAWSPNGNQIAFAGSEGIIEPRQNIFSGLPGFNDFLDHPWGLYITDPKFSDTELLLSNIIVLRWVQWSPDSRFISFVGEYEGFDGLWLYDVESKIPYHIWDYDVGYNWSPSGDQIMVLGRDGNYYILDIPEVINQ